MNQQVVNPFSRIRAEQMGDAAWRYYVKDPFKEYITERPLIFEGSRGTGKTMFFRCNSWREKFAEAAASGYSLESFIKSHQYIGFYYKADGRFIKSLSKKNIEDATWIGIFNTYFNIVISMEIIDFLRLLISENLIQADTVLRAVKQICVSLGESEANDLDALQERFENTITRIEQFSNNTEMPKPIGLNAGTIIEKLLLAGKQNEILRGTTFHVFVDEYEVLNADQQVELNTLLKQSNSNIVYDFGVITRGIQTFKTGSGQDIRPKDDFLYLRTDKYDYYERDSYNILLQDICKKRLQEQLDKTGKPYNPIYLDINTYLKYYGKNYEEALFEKSSELNKIKERILVELNRQAKIYQYEENEIQEFCRELTNCKPILLRMHLALLMRKGRYAVSAKRLIEQKEKDSAEYREWIHNMEPAIIFLLCHELKVEKKYHGLKVYSALSSGVIRSFLELAEYAFDYAFNNSETPFSFEDPREFTVDEQTKAVYFVSKFKIAEIDSYEPSGLQLKTFTIALGKIFSALHTNSNSTLGEVEFNHFSSKVIDLKKDRPDAAVFLKHAIMHKVVEEEEPTKKKSDEVMEFADYHLNHIYCPAFKISHLRKRKIQISAADLAKLLCGSQKEIDEVVNKLSGITEDNSPNLFTTANDISGEI